ncbi:hypothetical protein GOBAR_DD07317 [Gossypium barbadense]|nr:hypothetical protein GOBAR_DD07317 [Gossypium barbadense]
MLIPFSFGLERTPPLGAEVGYCVGIVTIGLRVTMHSVRYSMYAFMFRSVLCEVSRVAFSHYTLGGTSLNSFMGSGSPWSQVYSLCPATLFCAPQHNLHAVLQNCS